MTLIPQYSSCGSANVTNLVRLGAGVQWGGTGGFLQGGSHSLLSSWKGLGVDQVLEYDVVTVDGQRKIVSPCQNSDLFYALSGGVGGTYDVVVSVVLRIFRSPHIIGTLLSIEASNEALYATLIRDFVRFLPKLAEAKTTAFIPSFYEAYKLALTPSDPTGYNMLRGSSLIPDTVVRHRPDDLVQLFLQMKRLSVKATSLLINHVAG
ncbi:unnamed protein product [Rotaria magnacalcarata]|uniref:FAD-binding PCMH-type domain-containing protein n=1 Tax=Rotaria magnacalcarata TaxID=392030 RepID=A0A819Q9N9_9BILA|nr:unnamed protein product [Rotaria magnacalcarata]CAF4021136.1 unnamed protein product [Rotaria magnacalcarata]CAF4179163.1 unnamed protein product [Rotaria magnacalcarata]